MDVTFPNSVKWSAVKKNTASQMLQRKVNILIRPVSKMSNYGKPDPIVFLHQMAQKGRPESCLEQLPLMLYIRMMPYQEQSHLKMPYIEVDQTTNFHHILGTNSIPIQVHTRDTGSKKPRTLTSSNS